MGQDRSPLVTLLRSATNGDASSREILLASLFHPVRGYLGRKLTDLADGADTADDLAQEVLIRLNSKLELCQAEDDRAVVAWALQVARRRLVDFFGSPRQASIRLEDTGGVCDESTHPTVPTRGIEVLVRELRRALRGTPQETVRILWLKGQRSLDWKTIAAELGTTPGGAKRRFQRACARVRREVLSRVSVLPLADRGAVLAHIEQTDDE